MSNSGMDIQVVRRQNLQKIIDDRFDGKSGRLASEVKKPHPNISQALSGKRPFGENLARSIESALDLPDYWLDKDHTAELSEDVMQGAQNLMALPADERSKLLWLIAKTRALADFGIAEQPGDDESQDEKKQSAG